MHVVRAVIHWIACCRDVALTVDPGCIREDDRARRAAYLKLQFERYCYRTVFPKYRTDGYLSRSENLGRLADNLACVVDTASGADVAVGLLFRSDLLRLQQAR